MTAVYTQIVNAVAAAVQAISPPLAGITDAVPPHVYPRKLPTDRGISLPAVVVSVWDREKWDSVLGGEPGSSETVYTGYPVLLALVKPTNQALPVDDVELDWRARLIVLFRDKLLPAVAAVWKVDVEPQPVIDLEL